VATEHYSSANYDTLDRFISYYVQKELVLNSISGIENSKILEIGKGSGFLNEYLSAHGCNIKTFDFDESLKPDYVGDIRELSTAAGEKFDTIVCFEVLEHIPFDEVPEVLDQLAETTNNICIISVPQFRLYVSYWLKFPELKPFKGYLSLPFYRNHKFKGQHYWELGYRGYTIRRFKRLINKKFLLQQDFTHPLMPYHHFFYLRKKEQK
jgi:hypothetical protein